MFVLFLLLCFVSVWIVCLVVPGGMMKRVWCQLKLKEVESKSIWGGSEYRGYYILECVKVLIVVHSL